MTLKLPSTSIKLSVPVQSSAGIASARTFQSQAKLKEKKQAAAKANPANMGWNTAFLLALPMHGLPKDGGGCCYVSGLNKLKLCMAHAKLI